MEFTVEGVLHSRNSWSKGLRDHCRSRVEFRVFGIFTDEAIYRIQGIYGRDTKNFKHWGKAEQSTGVQQITPWCSTNKTMALDKQNTGSRQTKHWRKQFSINKTLVLDKQNAANSGVSAMFKTKSRHTNRLRELPEASKTRYSKRKRTKHRKQRCFSQECKSEILKQHSNATRNSL